MTLCEWPARALTPPQLHLSERQARTRARRSRKWCTLSPAARPPLLQHRSELQRAVHTGLRRYICTHHSFGHRTRLWHHKGTHTSAPLPGVTDWVTGTASGEKGWSRTSACSSV